MSRDIDTYGTIVGDEDVAVVVCEAGVGLEPDFAHGDRIVALEFPDPHTGRRAFLLDPAAAERLADDILAAVDMASGRGVTTLDDA